MSFSIIVKPEAEQDLQEAFDWYEKQQSGLGDALIMQVELVFEYLRTNPESFQKRYKEVRINFTDRFPFGVHYLIESNTIIVLAILHMSRDPLSWRS